MSFETRYALEASENSTGLSQQDGAFSVTGNGKQARSRILSKKRSTYADLLEASPESTMRLDSISHMLEESVESKYGSEPVSGSVVISHPNGSRTKTHRILDLSQLPASSLTGMDTPPRHYTEDSDGIQIDEHPNPHHAAKDSLVKANYLTDLLEADSGATGGSLYGGKSDISPEVSLSLHKSDSKYMDNMLTTGPGLAAVTIDTLTKDTRPKPTTSNLNLPPSGRSSTNTPGSHLGQGHTSDLREPLAASHQLHSTTMQPKKPSASNSISDAVPVEDVTGGTDLILAMESYGTTDDIGRSFKPYPKFSALSDHLSTPLYEKIADTSERTRNYYLPDEIQIVPLSDRNEQPEMAGSGLASILDHGVEIHPTQSQLGQVTQFLEGKNNGSSYVMLHESLGAITEEGSSPHSMGTPLMRPHNRPSSASMTHYPGHPINRTQSTGDLGSLSLTGYQPLPELPSTLSQGINSFVFPQSYDYYSHPVYSQSPQNRPTANPFSPGTSATMALAPAQDVYKVTDTMEDETVPAIHKPRRGRSASKQLGKSSSPVRSRASSRPRSHQLSQNSIRGGATHALASSIISGIGCASNAGLKKSRAPSRRGDSNSHRHIGGQSSTTSSSAKLTASKSGKSLKKSTTGGKSSTKKRAGSYGASTGKSKSPLRKSSVSKKVARSTSTTMGYASKQTSMISESANTSMTDPETGTIYSASSNAHRQYTKYDLGQPKSPQDVIKFLKSSQNITTPDAMSFNYVPKNNDSWPLIPQQKVYAQSAIGTVMGTDPMFPPRSSNQMQQTRSRDAGYSDHGDNHTQGDSKQRQRPLSAGKVKAKGRANSRASSRSASRNSSFAGSRPSSAHTQNESDYPLEVTQQRTPITIESLVPRNITVSPRFEVSSRDNQLRGSIATQNDRLHNDLRNLIKQKLIGISDPASPSQGSHRGEILNGDEYDQKAPRSPVDLRQLKGVYSKNYEHIHGNVMISAGEKRYKVVGYSQK